MLKRKASLQATPPQLAKRIRLNPDRLSRLSDEVLLRIFLHLPIETVATCHRVSQRLKDIAGDSQVWKSAYHSRFVWPRLLARKSKIRTRTALSAASWLDERALLNSDTDWKRQYKVRHNWSQGSCSMSELPLASPSPPPLLARLHAGTVVTVDRTSGVRAWAYRGRRQLLASCDLAPEPGKPLCLTLDTDSKVGEDLRIAVGFDDGAIKIYALHRSSNIIHLGYEGSNTCPESIAAVAIASSYLATLTNANLLSVYNIPLREGPSTQPLRRLASVRSSSIRSPFSMSLRLRGDAILASIAYGMSNVQIGWSIGLQELTFSLQGESMNSRLASTTAGRFTSLITLGFASDGVDFDATELQSARPTSLHYSHPYLLATHRDNTLTLFVVTSTNQALSISDGKSLWGHSSSVSGVQIGGRGKAVSVSSPGGEVRVWELERATTGRRGVADNASQSSIPVTPKGQSAGSNILRSTLSKALQMSDQHCSQTARHGRDWDTSYRSWVGFDEENVVVMQERRGGDHALTVYDFT